MQSVSRSLFIEIINLFSGDHPVIVVIKFGDQGFCEVSGVFALRLPFSLHKILEEHRQLLQIELLVFVDVILLKSSEKPSSGLVFRNILLMPNFLARPDSEGSILLPPLLFPLASLFAITYSHLSVKSNNYNTFQSSIYKYQYQMMKYSIKEVPAVQNNSLRKTKASKPKIKIGPVKSNQLVKLSLTSNSVDCQVKKPSSKPRIASHAALQQENWHNDRLITDIQRYMSKFQKKLELSMQIKSKWYHSLQKRQISSRLTFPSLFISIIRISCLASSRASLLSFSFLRSNKSSKNLVTSSRSNKPFLSLSYLSNCSMNDLLTSFSFIILSALISFSLLSRSVLVFFLRASCFLRSLSCSSRLVHMPMLTKQTALNQFIVWRKAKSSRTHVIDPKPVPLLLENLQPQVLSIPVMPTHRYMLALQRIRHLLFDTPLHFVFLATAPLLLRSQSNLYVRYRIFSNSSGPFIGQTSKQAILLRLKLPILSWALPILRRTLDIGPQGFPRCQKLGQTLGTIDKQPVINYKLRLPRSRTILGLILGQSIGILCFRFLNPGILCIRGGLVWVLLKSGSC